MAWIYKRGAKWWIGWRSADGKLVQRSLKTARKDVAEAELSRLRLIEQAHAAKALTADFVASLTGKRSEKKKTVTEYLDAWLENARTHLAQNTASKYEQAVREFKAHIKADAAPVLMEDVTADDVRGYLMDKRRRSEASTVKGFRRILSSIFLQAQNEGQTTRNPVALAKLPKTVEKEGNGKRAFTLKEVKELHTKATPFWRYMVTVGFYTGLSLGDIITLRRLAVDLRQGTLSVKRRKTGKHVTVPLGAGLLAEFSSLWPKKAEGYFWPKEAERYETTGASSFSQEFYDLLASCGYVEPREGPKVAKKAGRSAKRERTGLGFHCLRHTFVSYLKIAGAMDSVAKELAGHGSSAVSAVYTHLPPETLASAVAALPDFQKEDEK